MTTMLSRRTAVVLAGTFLVPVPTIVEATVEEDVRAPFGLSWGMTSDEIRKSGARLAAISGRSNYGVRWTPCTGQKAD